MNLFSAELLAALLRTTAYLAVAAVLIRVLLGATRCSSPTVHRVAWCLVLIQGWLFIRLPVEIPYSEAQPRPPNRTSDPPVAAITRPPGEATSESLANIPERSPAHLAPSPLPGPATPSPASASISPAPTASRPGWPAVLTTVWLGGMIVLAGGTLIRYRRFLRRLPPGRPAEESWVRQWEDLLARRGIRAKISLRITTRLGPLLCRLPGGYELVIPTKLWQALAPAERLMILRHELAHYVRGDSWKSLAIRLLALPHWFNPLVWWAVRKFDACAEWACDQEAAGAEPHSATDYVRTLLQLGEAPHDRPSCTPAAQGRELALRIRRLLRSRPLEDSVMKKVIVISAMLGLVALCLVRFELVAKESAADKPPAVVAAEKEPVAEQPPAEESPERVLLKKHVETLRALRPSVQARFDLGLNDQTRLIQALNDLLKAELELCTSQAQRIDVYEKMLKHFKELDAIVEAKHDAEAKGGSEMELLEARAVRIQVELQLQRERAKAQRPPSSQPANPLAAESLPTLDPRPADLLLDKPGSKGALRYDAKTFGEWKEEARTELKPERLTEAIRAFAVFGAHGHGKEATAAIVEIMRGYDVTTIPDTPVGRLNMAARAAFRVSRSSGAQPQPIEPASAVPVLTAELKRGNRNGRGFAAYALMEIGPQAKPALPSLMEAVAEEQDSGVWEKAVQAVLSIDESGEKIASVLRETIRRGEGEEISRLLYSLVPPDPFQSYHGRATIFRPTGGPNWRIELAPRAQPVIKAIIEAIGDEREAVRQEVFQALERIGPAAKEAIPLLKKAAADENGELRKLAEKALEAVSPPEDRPTIR